MKDHRRLGISVLLLFAALAVSFLWIRTIVGPNQSFQSELWKDQSLHIDNSSLRLEMVKDLQRNILKHGMTRDEIESLLGKSELILPTHMDDLTYLLGSDPDSGTTTRSGATVRLYGREHWLVLKLNNNERLTDWRIVTR
ncbi:MAG: hypothetical protein ACSHX5_10385 [Phycisphaerales bacterium]